MYCIKCGVKLADSEKKCPLCGTVPYHPEIAPNSGKPTYKAGIKPRQAMNKYAVMVLISVFYAIAMILLVLCDVMVTKSISWSFYAAGGLLLSYFFLILPLWFKTVPSIAQQFVPSVILPSITYSFASGSEELFVSTNIR